MDNPFKEIFDKLEIIQQSILELNTTTLEAPPEDDITNVKGASKILDTTSGTIYNLVWKNLIPYSKRGKKLYFSKKELLNWIKEGQIKTKAEINKEVNQKLTEQKRGVRRKSPLNTPSREQGKDTDFSHFEKGE